MKNYLHMLRDIRSRGTIKSDRTGVGTQSLFGYQLRFALDSGFPLVTTKKVHWKSIVMELLWFLRGDTNVRWLQGHGVKIWDEWAAADGELGPMYGQQWRSWPTTAGDRIDQLQQLLIDLRERPDSRRHIVTAWNPESLPDESISPQQNVAAGRMALAPCHALFQFYVANDRLSCQLYQRSADAFLGVPFNIASYALLTHMVAQDVGLLPGDYIHTFGDVHIYRNHVEQVDTQLQREPYPLPTLRLNEEIKSLFDFGADDIRIDNYQCHPPLRGKVAV
jgi:thymidylate synthase